MYCNMQVVPGQYDNMMLPVSMVVTYSSPVCMGQGSS